MIGWGSQLIASIVSSAGRDGTSALDGLSELGKGIVGKSYKCSVTQILAYKALRTKCKKITLYARPEGVSKP